MSDFSSERNAAMSDFSSERSAIISERSAALSSRISERSAIISERNAVMLEFIVLNRLMTTANKPMTTARIVSSNPKMGMLPLSIPRNLFVSSMSLSSFLALGAGWREREAAYSDSAGSASTRAFSRVCSRSMLSSLPSIDSSGGMRRSISSVLTFISAVSIFTEFISEPSAPKSS